MSTDRLNPLSYVVLALIGRGGAGAHDLVSMVRRGARLYWSASPSKMYAEPKRLETLGYVSAKREPGRTRERTLYTLTPAGEEALREWVATPASFPRIYSDAVGRLLAADLVDDETLLRSLSALRAETRELHERIDEGLEVAATLPHRERHLRLVHSLGRKLVEAHEAWLDELEAELGQEPRSTSSVASGRAK